MFLSPILINMVEEGKEPHSMVIIMDDLYPWSWELLKVTLFNADGGFWYLYEYFC